MVGTGIFAAGVFVAIRETIPSYNRLLGAYIGVFGLAKVVEGWTPMRLVLVLIGLVAGLDLTRRLGGVPSRVRDWEANLPVWSSVCPTGSGSVRHDPLL